MDINFHARYLNYYDIINDVIRLNDNLQITMFHFFKNDQLLYTKKMVYNYNNYNYYRISNSVLNSFYEEKKYKISYMHYVILLTDIYIHENQKLIYMNVYKDNLLRTFIIGIYYKFLSRDYISYSHQHIYNHVYYNWIYDWIGDFYCYDYYITKQEINNVCDQLAIYGHSIELLYTL